MHLLRFTLPLRFSEVRDPVKVAHEIEFWRRDHGVQDFAFYDDALLTPRPHATRILKEIISRDLSVSFHCPNGLHAREITRETAMLMRQAGFATIRLGLETSDPLRQHRTGGKVTNSSLLMPWRTSIRQGIALMRSVSISCAVCRARGLQR